MSAQFSAKQVTIMMDLMSVISHLTAMQMVNHPNTPDVIRQLVAVQNAFLNEFLSEEEKQKLTDMAKAEAAKRGIITPNKSSIIIPRKE